VSCAIIVGVKLWRVNGLAERVGVEPTGDRKTCRPPVLKITRSVLTRYENSLIYLICQPVTNPAIRVVLSKIAAI
jgi:hypothetical protein